jgi:beta-lactamase regulating signal transducer with metallopeptidase domain
MMTPDLHFWSQLLVRLAVEAACVVGIAWLLDRMIRPAFWRRALWQSAAVCLLLLTASELSGFGRGLAGYLFGHARPEPKFVLAANPVAAAPMPPPAVASAAAPVFTPAPLPLPLPPVVKAVVPGPVWWPGLLWLGGAFVILGRVAVAQMLFISLRRRRPAPARGDLHERADAILQRLAVRRKIRVLQSPGLTGPLAFGILRPSVGLPADFAAKFSRAEQDAMLAHELAHLAAHDPLWYLLADVGSAALWWQPLAWWARRRLHRASELAADEAASIFPDGPAALAGCLVTLGKQMTQRPAGSWMGVEGGGFRSNLAERVQRLLHLADAARQPSYGWRARAARLGTILAISAAALGLAGCLQSRDTVKQPTLQANLSQSWETSPASTVWHSALPAPKPITVLPVKHELWVVDAAQPVSPPVPIAVPGPKAEQDGVSAKSGIPPVPIAEAAANPADASKGREAIVRKLQAIKLREVTDEFEQGLPLSEVLKRLTQLSISNDLENAGVNFLFNPRVGGNPVGEQIDAGTITIRITPPLKNVTLLQLMDAIRQMADQPIDFSVSDYAVWFFVKPPANAALGSKLQPFLGPAPGTSNERDANMRKLQDLRMKEQPSGFEQGLPLTEVLRILNKFSISNEVDNIGVNFLFNPRVGAHAAGEQVDPGTISVRINPPLKNVTFLQLLDAICQMADQPLGFSVTDYAVWFFVRPPAAAAPEAPVPAVTAPAPTPARAKENQIVPDKAESTAVAPLETRMFRVDPAAFIHQLQGVAPSVDVEQVKTTVGGIGGGIGGSGGIQGTPKHPTPDAEEPYYHYVTNRTPAAQSLHFIVTNSFFTNNMIVTRYFGSLGINLTNNGAFAVFNPRNGDVVVRVTTQDLDKVERAIAQINKPPVLVQIDVKVARAPLSAPVFNMDSKDITISPAGTNGGAAPSFQASPATTNPSGIFPAVYNSTTSTNAAVFRAFLLLDANLSRSLLTTIERLTNADILACPRITTESGRQAHIAVNGIADGTHASAISREVTAVDVLPTISPDGFFIQIAAVPSGSVYVGYDKPNQSKPETWAGDDRPFPPVRLPPPSYRVNQTVIETNVLDGQTLVLRALLPENATNKTEQLLIFITPTIVDPAGHPVHTDAEMPAFPPQPPTTGQSK